MHLEIVESLAHIEPAAWDALAGQDDPFVEHGFLYALERSGSVGQGTGFLPMHLTLHEHGSLVGALPLYLKQHSYGEYVFDFGWASAAQRAGIAYYPKLVSMVPFTPATGRRVLYAQDQDPERITKALLAAALDLSQQTRASSIHLHFLNADEHARIVCDRRFMPRLSSQFHWHNAGFKTFDEHLATFRSAQRKEVKRERRRAAEAGCEIRVVAGSELSADDWSALADFYEQTCLKHGSGPYLTRAFFEEIKNSHAQRVVAVLAKRDGQAIAGTLNFEKGKHLYGRYWGAKEEQPYLHFELCYHRLIERAIERGYTRFEAGAQGMHKLRRGLLPSEVRSACYIADPRLAEAIADFLPREELAVREQMEELQHHGPSHRPHVDRNDDDSQW